MERRNTMPVVTISSKREQTCTLWATMKLPLHFRLRSLFVLTCLVAIGTVIWQSMPTHGNPILYGQVLDSDGAPIPNVEIVLYSGMATRFPAQSTRTDERGQFVFSPLKTGTIIFSETGGFDDIFVGISATHPQYRAADGAEWWDISVPRIHNRKHRWDLEMIPKSNDTAGTAKN